MSTLKVSVVVAAFNAEETIEPLVQSLLNLDYPDYEVIVVNDGSTDNTREILQKYPVTLIDQENQGASAARNRGLMEASGEIVAYTDSDTVVDRGWLKELVKHFEDRRVGAVTGKIVFGRDDHCTSWVRSLDFELRNARRGPLTRLANGPNSVFRRGLLLEVGGFNPRWFHAEDTEVSYKIWNKGYKIIYEPDAVVYHAPESEWVDFLRKRYRDAKGFTRVLYSHTRSAAIKDDFVTLGMKIQPLLFAVLLLSSPLIALSFLVPSLEVFPLIWIILFSFGVLLNLPFSLEVASRSGRGGFLFKCLTLTLARGFCWGLGLVIGLLKNISYFAG